MVWVQLQPEHFIAPETGTSRDDHLNRRSLQHAFALGLENSPTLVLPAMPSPRFPSDTPVDSESEMRRAAASSLAAAAIAEKQTRAFARASSPESVTPLLFSIFQGPVYDIGRTLHDDTGDLKTYIGQAGNSDCFLVANLPNEGAGWHDAVRCAKKNRQPRIDQFQHAHDSDQHRAAGSIELP
jgi:hypothetical protein